MKTAHRTILLTCLAWLGLSGCGGKSPSASGSSGCSGVVISGTLQDSLTHQPVAQGTAVLEARTELGTTPAYEFYPTTKAATDAAGTFSLCTPSIAAPSAVVIEAMDSTGKAYPPFVAPVSGATALGVIPMGGCTVICGLDGQQETSSPATITGAITSAPTAIVGTVTPQFALEALDGSKSANGTPNLWAIAIPSLNAAQSFAFQTAAGTCAASAAFCGTYRFTLPSQSPVWRVSGGTLQPTVAPTYLIYATADSTADCNPSSAVTIYQADGASLLTANPGAQLSAATLSFSGCH